MTPSNREIRNKLFQRRKEGDGSILKAARLEKNIGTRTLAAMAGISLSTIRNAERGRADVKVETLQVICDVLDRL